MKASTSRGVAVLSSYIKFQHVVSHSYCNFNNTLLHVIKHFTHAILCDCHINLSVICIWMIRQAKMTNNVRDWFGVHTVESRSKYWALRYAKCQFLCIWQNTIYVNILGSIRQILLEPSMNVISNTMYGVMTLQDLMINSVKCSGKI